jgi:sec-independent protein translocase protein TatA
MFKIGLTELIVIFLAVILLFGAKALPDIAKGLAQAIKNFREGIRGIGNEVNAAKRKDEDQKKSTDPDHKTNSNS